MIEHLVPDDIKNLSYYEVSKARGFDLKRFYSKVIHVFCPHCITPANGNTSCSSLISEQNQLSMTESEYLNSKRVRCKSCEGPVLEIANVCFLCQEQQNG
ncbi:MAG: hypothetical protein COA38_02915 [Fluviicola sp.]|nr:MAG: hypothetical protein COA38_02915 [Fluviicola sp.]